MEIEPNAVCSDSTSAEYLDAESEVDQNDYFQDAEEQKHSIICEILGGEAEASELPHISKDAVPSSTTPSLSSEKSKEIAGSVESLPSTAALTPTPTPAMVASTTMAVSASAPAAMELLNAADDDDVYDYLHDPVWRGQKKHIFILSEAGKPIYSLHGVEDKLATLFGIIQALVSFVQNGQDAITSIHAQGIKFIFLVRNSLILVAASRTNMSVPQLQMQLSDVYNQILSTLTYSHMTKIFEKRKNFDLRRLLAGSERLIYNLLSNDSSNKRITNNVFTFLTNSIRILPLAPAMRANITSAIQSNCAKIKNLVFAVLLANNKLIALVRMKKYSINPSDLRLIFNLIECSESFKASENWTPICLPKFDMNGYLHAHVSYLADDCQACLLLLSVDRDVFFTLSDAKRRITEKLRRSRCLEAINEAMSASASAKLHPTAIGIPELRHFLYKPRSLAQLLCAEITPPYATCGEFERLEAIYCNLLHRIHNTDRPLKLIYQVQEREVTLAWVTAAYELYAVFEPLVEKAEVIKYIDKLIKWIEKEHDVYFIRNHPTF